MFYVLCIIESVCWSDLNQIVTPFVTWCSFMSEKTFAVKTFTMCILWMPIKARSLKINDIY